MARKRTKKRRKKSQSVAIDLGKLVSMPTKYRYMVTTRDGRRYMVKYRKDAMAFKRILAKRGIKAYIRKID